jgi:murein DD-endopeptidase MepM/ murein hydrolase activator NlpD
MTRDLLRPALLARKVLLPPLLAGAVFACLLAALAAASGGGPRAKDRSALAPAATQARTQAVISQFTADLEGALSPADIRRARRPPGERRRLLAAHPYYALYSRAQRRYGVPWLLVASTHYQETGFRRGEKAVMAIAAQLNAARARDLGASADRAAAARYGSTPEGRLSAAMVVERARAWRLLGTLPLPGRGELATPTRGVVGGCGLFGCPRPGHLHNGLDMLAPTGTPVHAADAGRVAVLESIGESGGYGNFVCLQHRPHLATCYAHLSAVAAGLRVGSRVRRGEVIGLVGSTGSSTAPHLHFEVRRGPATCSNCAIDPAPLLSGDVPQAVVPQMLRRGGEVRERLDSFLPRAVNAAGPGAGPGCIDGSRQKGVKALANLSAAAQHLRHDGLRHVARQQRRGVDRAVRACGGAAADLEVQVRRGARAGRADEPDHLSAAHA